MSEGIVSVNQVGVYHGTLYTFIPINSGIEL